VPLALLFLVVVPALCVYGFVVWRSHDLVEKALASAESGNQRLAVLQARSALRLLPSDTKVLRSAALVETKAGAPEAFELWQRLAQTCTLTADEQVMRAEVALALGHQDAAEEAQAALEAAGQAASFHRLRAGIAAASNDLDGAIAETRVALESSQEPSLRLNLAKLLVHRHARLLSGGSVEALDVEAARDFREIINSLLSTPEAAPALALALEPAAFPMSDAVAREEWARVALRDPRPENPALLPAASVLCSGGTVTAADLQATLRPVFAQAPLALRSAFAQWLALHGQAQEGLRLVSLDEARTDPAAFAAVAQAFVVQDRGADLLRLSGKAGEAVPAWLRSLAEARASTMLGNVGSAEHALRDAIVQSLPVGVLPHILWEADVLGAGALADRELVELCARPDSEGVAFGIARSRFVGKSNGENLAAAFKAASSVSPSAPPVADYRIYLRLLRGGEVDPAETADALRTNPAGIMPRINHALALLQSGHPREALASLDRCTVFLEELPPGARVVVAALYAANGQSFEARAALSGVSADDLCSDEEFLYDKVKGALPPP
jgi:hypothetical protein